MLLITKLKRFFQWWGEGLLKGIPKPLRALFRTEIPRLVVQMQGLDAFIAKWKQDGKYKELGDYTLNDGQVALFDNPPKWLHRKKHLLEVQLDPKQGLSLDQNFPDAVEENLSQVIGYQLDRITPFSADKAYYSARAISHDKANKEIKVNVQVIPKRNAHQLIERLKAKGAPDINLVSVAGGEPAIPIGTTTSKDIGLAWSWIPVAFMVSALIATLAVPIAYKYRRVEQIDGALTQVRNSATEQLSIRDQLTSAQDALQFLAERRRNAPVVLDIVEQLSAILPKNTWLSRLTITDKELQITGESEAALDLIDVLEEAKEFSNVKFKSPVTRNKENGRDKFQIQVQIEVANGQ